MKVLIADDEIHVIEAITLLVPWDQLGIHQVLTASSVAESREIIGKYQPEIVITDTIMADATGIDLINFINEKHPSTKVISISGHNDFDYVRTMLTAGSIDYLLKPLEAGSLINTISRAVEAWNRDFKKNQEDKRMLHQIGFLSDQYSQNLLYKMLRGTEPDEYYELIRIDPRFANVRSGRFLYLNADFIPAKDPACAKLLGQMEETVKEYLLYHQNGIFFYSPLSPEVMFLFVFDRVEEALDYVRKVLEGMGGRGYPCHMGCSEMLRFPDHFREMYLQARTAYFSVDCRRAAEPTVHWEESMEPEDNVARPDLENQMLSAILVSGQSQVEEATGRWLNEFFDAERVPLSLVRSLTRRYRELYAHWVEVLAKWHPHIAVDPGRCAHSYHELVNENNLFAPEKLKAVVLADIAALVERTGQEDRAADVFHRIAYHMELNHSQPFSQAEYAKLFYLNKDYMCRKFKKTFNVSMVSYLNRIRIEQAKQLMRNTDMSLKSISYQVGYEDEKYFTRQFKMQTGTTPSQFREREA